MGEYPALSLAEIEAIATQRSSHEAAAPWVPDLDKLDRLTT